MLIREGQMAAFRAEGDKAFAGKAAKRLTQLFPKHTAMMGAAAVNEIVQLGTNRARGYGFRSERGIQTYLSLMIYFGTEFHRDPQYEWVHPLVETESPGDEKARIDRIIQATGDYAVAVPGPNHEHVDEALATLLERGPAIVKDPQRPITVDSVRLLLHQVYAKKATHLAEPGMTTLIQTAHAASRKHQFAAGEPIILFSLLMLLLGSYVDEDPQFAWFAATLAETCGQPEGPRLDAVVNRCFERLRAWTSE
jgi:hypothetical protein